MWIQQQDSTTKCLAGVVVDGRAGRESKTAQEDCLWVTGLWRMVRARLARTMLLATALGYDYAVVDD